jgi:hypothetical protein
MQWHPLFAELLRPLVENYYEVRTNIPVGDLPRAADLALLRRTSSTAPPFRGLWRWLTPWNVLEFKGPSVSARLNDLDSLIELGLGIHRHLNEERHKQRQRRVGRADVTFWYLANHVGRRFLRGAGELLGEGEELGRGVWRWRLAGRSLILVSNRDVPVERDTVPVHLLASEPPDTARELAREVVSQPDLWPLYGGWLAVRFPDLWPEVQQMAHRGRQSPVIDFRPLIEKMGMDEFVRHVDLEFLMNKLGAERLMQAVGPERLIEAVGAERLMQAVGPERLVEAVGLKRLIQKVGLRTFVAQLTPKERHKFQELLQQNERSPDATGEDTTTAPE